jgi:hypothetical protein
MTNPTTQAGLQFTAPYNILPDLMLKNPTAPYQSQFYRPFNILPDPLFPNPTAAVPSQFQKPFNILPDPAKLPDPNIGNPLEPKPATTFPGPPPVENNGVFVTKLANAEVLEKNAESAPYRNWTAGEWVHTNVNLKTVGSNVLGFISLAAGSLFGIPQIGQIGQNGVGGKSENDGLSGTYTSLPFDKLKSPELIKYSDFRSRLNIDLDSDQGAGQQTLAYITSRRVDGFSAALRGSVKAGFYSAAAVSPLGPYSVFNLDGVASTGYGYGEHDHPDAIRKDFTMRSHIATHWIPGTSAVLLGSDILGSNALSKAAAGRFARTFNPAELATPFRGDKVNVVDFGQRRLKDAYLWNPDRLFSIENVLGMNLDRLGMTQDFIKFYLTGPKLQAGSDFEQDDIMVFRATIQDINDSHGASWNPQQMIGRADPNYIYGGYTRDLSISFDIYATDRDEMQPIYRKLNALAGYTAPTYNPESIAMEAPWMRITIGDLFVQTPVVLKSVGLTFGGSDSPWEINIEEDPNMMQAPLKISVSLSFNVVSDYLPQKGGRFYTLAKRFAADAQPLAGNDNWLSDSKGNLDLIEQALRWKLRRKKQKTAGAGTTIVTNT